MLRFLTATILLAALAACAPEIKGEIHYAAILAAGDGGGDLTMPITIRIPQGSLEDCHKELDKYASAVAKFTPVTGDATCTDSDGDTFAVFPSVMKIIGASDPLPADHLAYLVTSSVDAPAGRELSFGLTHPINDVVDAIIAVSEIVTARPELDAPKFEFVFTNDSTSDFSLNPLGIFVDDQPGVAGKEPPIQVGAGQSVTLRLNDVVSAYLGNGGAASPFAIISPAPPQ